MEGGVCGLHTGDVLGVPLVISLVSLGVSQAAPALRWLQDYSNSMEFVWQSSENPKFT